MSTSARVVQERVVLARANGCFVTKLFRFCFWNNGQCIKFLECLTERSFAMHRPTKGKFVEMLILRWPVLVVLGAFLGLFFIALALYFWNGWSGSFGFEGKQYPERFAAYNETLMTHRMVRFDLDNGLTDAIFARKAWGNIDWFLRSVKHDCHDNASTFIFLQCANQILGENFQYQPFDAVSPAYSTHHSDCDTRLCPLIA